MGEQWADEFGPNYAEMRFGQRATGGNEESEHSRALLGVDEAWRGTGVRVLQHERAVIDHGPEMDVEVTS